MFLLNWTEDIDIEHLDNKSVFVHSTDQFQIQFRTAEAINQNFAFTPFNIICNLINNVTVFMVNLIVLVCLKNKVLGSFSIAKAILE